MKVLVVEDSLVSLRLLSENFEKMGYAVLEAKNGEEGIKLWETENPEFVVTDWNMPVKSGLELVKHIRTSSGQQYYTYIILITARGDENCISEAFEAGVDDYLTKSEKLSQNPKYKNTINPNFIKNIYDTSPLHDIGKVGIPDYILLKKWDGKGYPLGLKGLEISLSARIVALADVYDALRSQRSYKEAMSHKVACTIIVSESGTHFDPDIVFAFMEIENRFKEISERYSLEK